MHDSSSKIRIYDLAKELKLDTKRLIEEVRREGVDVSVPSNSVSKELAEKIRNKYFPKKETAVKRAVKIVKKAARPVEETPSAEPETPIEVEPPPAPVESAPPPSAETAAPVAGVPKPVAKLMKKLPPAARAEPPAAAVAGAEPASVPEESLESFEVESLRRADVRRPPPVESSKVPGASHQIRVMRPTAAALNAGIRPGERAPTPIAPPITPKERAERSGRVRDRNSLTRTERLGTPGETATPQTTYIPPPDAAPPFASHSRSRRTHYLEGKGDVSIMDCIRRQRASLEDRSAVMDSPFPLLNSAL